MISEYFTTDGITVMYDSNEDLYYLQIMELCTEDYTKEELINLLKSIVNSLGETSWTLYKLQEA